MKWTPVGGALLAVGVVLTVAILAVLDVLEPGSAADWAAAVGTVGALSAALYGLNAQAREGRHAERHRFDQEKRTQQQLEVMQDQAQAAQVQARIAREQLAAATRPLLVSPRSEFVEKGFNVSFTGREPVYCQDSGGLLLPAHDAQFVYVAAPLVNIGAGVAFLRGLSINLRPEIGWSGRFGQTVLRPHDVTFVSFSIPADRPELGDLRQAVVSRQHFSISVSYTNAAGGDMLISRLSVHDGRVRQVFITDAEEVPLASTGPADG